MDSDTAIPMMRQWLLHDVAYLCRRSDRLWSAAIVQALRGIRVPNMRAVFFGGLLRSLLLSRIRGGTLGRPRDVDIVVTGTDIGQLRQRCAGMVRRETRFGGLHLEGATWGFDVWPLHRTWALAGSSPDAQGFRSLPATTFLNVEAIAVDVWPTPGRGREIYCGDGQFFDGIASQTVEINREDNPFPALCVVRSLLMAASIQFAVGPRLARYLTEKGAFLSDDELTMAQWKHYGKVRCEAGVLRNWLRHITETHLRRPTARIGLPLPRQLALWPAEHSRRVGIHVIAPRIAARARATVGPGAPRPAATFASAPQGASRCTAGRHQRLWSVG